MLARRRHERILATLRDDGPAEVARLAAMLDVSAATVRRDLAQLESEGRLDRVHGGAAPSGSAEAPFEQVVSHHAADREAVAARAASLVGDGEVVLLDIGTTTAAIARRLRGRPVTVITSSLAVYDELGRDPAVDLLLLGGTVRRNYRSLVGFLTEHAVAQVHADRLFLGTSGVRPDGSVLDTTAVEVPVKQAMLKAADRVVLVADDSKFPGSGFARVCGPDAVNVVVTGARADVATLAAFTEAGADVVRAPADDERTNP
ncbi:DeoR/GlpR family DNA-binding transcription regulator [Solicola sp. PLA-1-18]|uniref:DeoR/GlpR family DNA-binding transcription regulator n=1 Tax=Solicola sp. PLA-1-18 TaxID=3380532 RepID=UPI003B7FE751